MISFSLFGGSIFQCQYGSKTVLELNFLHKTRGDKHSECVIMAYFFVTLSKWIFSLSVTQKDFSSFHFAVRNLNSSDFTRRLFGSLRACACFSNPPRTLFVKLRQTGLNLKHSAGMWTVDIHRSVSPSILVWPLPQHMTSHYTYYCYRV